jgi:hypothetical protein
MKITQEIRDAAATSFCAAAQGMQEMSAKFRAGGSQIYAGSGGREHD